MENLKKYFLATRGTQKCRFVGYVSKEPSSKTSSTGGSFFSDYRSNSGAMAMIFCRDLPLGIWQLLRSGEVYFDTFRALCSDKKRKKYPFFMTFAILSSWLGYA